MLGVSLPEALARPVAPLGLREIFLTMKGGGRHLAKTSTLHHKKGTSIIPLLTLKNAGPVSLRKRAFPSSARRWHDFRTVVV